jgi:hypothetical protein
MKDHHWLTVGFATWAILGPIALDRLTSARWAVTPARRSGCLVLGDTANGIVDAIPRESLRLARIEAGRGLSEMGQILRPHLAAGPAAKLMNHIERGLIDLTYADRECLRDVIGWQVRFEIGDLLVTPEGTVGRLCYVDQDGKHAIEFPFSAQWELFDPAMLRSAEGGSAL